MADVMKLLSQHPNTIYPVRTHIFGPFAYALASGRFESIKDLPAGFMERINSGLDPENMQLMALLRQAQDRPVQIPLKAAAGMKRTDMMSMMIPLERPGHRELQPGAVSRAHTRPLISMSAGARQQRAFYVGFQQPAENIEVMVRYTFTGEGPRERWLNLFRVYLLDREY